MCVYGWVGVELGKWPNWEEIVVSWAPGRHFPNGEEWDLTYLHSNLFAYKHKTTFVSQKTRSSPKNRRGEWAQGARQWAWHMLKAIPGERHSLNLIIFAFIEAK